LLSVYIIHINIHSSLPIRYNHYFVVCTSEKLRLTSLTFVFSSTRTCRYFRVPFVRTNPSNRVGILTILTRYRHNVQTYGNDGVQSVEKYYQIGYPSVRVAKHLPWVWDHNSCRKKLNKTVNMICKRQCFLTVCLSADQMSVDGVSTSEG